MTTASRAHLQSEISVLHSAERGDSDGDGVHMRGADSRVPAANNGLAPGSKRTVGAADGVGEHHSGLAHDSAQRPQRALHRSDSAAYPERQMDIRRAKRLETGVSHGRTGTDAQGHSDPHGTGIVHHTSQPGQNSGGTATRPDSTQPGLAATPRGEQPDQGRFASLDTAIARLGRSIQELGNLVATLERHIERQIERARAWSRGPGLKM